MINLKMLTLLEDLMKITRCSRDKLWEVGFNLDDWDVCFVSDVPLTRTMCDSEGVWEDPLDEAWWLVLNMENWCVGYVHVEYAGKHYYMVYHSQEGGYDDQIKILPYPRRKNQSIIL